LVSVKYIHFDKFYEEEALVCKTSFKLTGVEFGKISLKSPMNLNVKRLTQDLGFTADCNWHQMETTLMSMRQHSGRSQ
jgi:hypothetical protein